LRFAGLAATYSPMS